MCKECKASSLLQPDAAGALAAAFPHILRKAPCLAGAQQRVHTCSDQPLQDRPAPDAHLDDPRPRRVCVSVSHRHRAPARLRAPRSRAQGRRVDQPGGDPGCVQRTCYARAVRGPPRDSGGAPRLAPALLAGRAQALFGLFTCVSILSPFSPVAQLRSVA